ncbi:hypothetical protein GFH30_03460 [Acinetobacter wanghuae]|uniref:Nucleotide modification associated domain-containing protein n=1 Tax=Acinetobacter wanghuae TaxID=2662362 RepID=A0A5Q0P1V5_9GAMM|nr:hypothetical protein [Acinetobacter wanghuae]MQW92272.1 hypothetical protein [Acinetobacter wanghuae]QGA10513.1 hypothetical protein GFH30_03460 [Acinetobacter wanghuae]
MNFFSYIVDRDFGFAPNPFYGFCTLANCKPRTRKSAKVGDKIFGLAGKKYRGDGGHRLIYAMEVTEILTFENYFNDKRFKLKKPTIKSHPKRQFGDNIYYQDSLNRYVQLDSHHSFPNAITHTGNRDHDTQVDKVLISDNFVYYGNNAILLPNNLLDNVIANKNITVKRHHKNRFHSDFISELEKYWQTLPRGIYGNPNEWK